MEFSWDEFTKFQGWLQNNLRKYSFHSTAQVGPDIKSKLIPNYSQNSLFFKTCSFLFEGFWLRKPKSWKRIHLLRCGHFFRTVSRELCGNFRWQMPGPMWKRPGVPFVYALHSLWTFWRRYPWTVGRLDVSWTFRAVILREYGRKVFFTLRYPEKKVNLHEPPHNDTLDC